MIAGWAATERLQRLCYRQGPQAPINKLSGCAQGQPNANRPNPNIGGAQHEPRPKEKPRVRFSARPLLGNGIRCVCSVYVRALNI